MTLTPDQWRPRLVDAWRGSACAGRQFLAPFPRVRNGATGLLDCH
jgi:hypothetical protein